jgi:hypothetical protein
MSDLASQRLKTALKQRIQEISSLKGYNYRLWRYEVSHSVLTIYAADPHEQKPNLVLTFGSVYYMQILLFWTGDLRPAPEDESLKIAKLAGFEGDKETIDELLLMAGGCTVFKADSPNGVIYILGSPQDIELYR